MYELPVYILDTTLREGELNSSIYYTPEMIERIGLALAELRTPRIEFSVAYPQRGGNVAELQRIIEAVQGSYSRVTTIVQCRALREDIELAREVGASGCGIYIAISEEHRKNKLKGMTVEEVERRITESIQTLKDYGFSYRRVVLEDASRYFSQYKGDEDALTVFGRLIKAADKAGATTISIPDTAGLLDTVQALEMFKYASGVTDKEVAAHFHNDYGNSLGNTLAVVRAGYAQEAHVSIYGLGSGVGIADHYEVSANLMDNMGVNTGERRGQLKELYSTFWEVTGLPVPWNHPLSDFARTEKAGTHQAQQLKSPGGYIPAKKLNHDFSGEVIFQVGRLMSSHLVERFLEGHTMSKEEVVKIATLLGRRSTLYNRKLNTREIKAIIRDVSGVEVSLAKISQYISPDKVIYLLRVRPQVTSEIAEAVGEYPGVINVQESFGIYDIIVEAYLDKDIANIIQEEFKESILELAPLIIG
jgi:2-isopropylmalate synthase